MGRLSKNVNFFSAAVFYRYRHTSTFPSLPFTASHPFSERSSICAVDLAGSTISLKYFYVCARSGKLQLLVGLIGKICKH